MYRKTFTQVMNDELNKGGILGAVDEKKRAEPGTFSPDPRELSKPFSRKGVDIKSFCSRCGNIMEYHEGEVFALLQSKHIAATPDFRKNEYLYMNGCPVCQEKITQLEIRSF